MNLVRLIENTWWTAIEYWSVYQCIYCHTKWVECSPGIKSQYFDKGNNDMKKARRIKLEGSQLEHVKVWLKNSKECIMSISWEKLNFQHWKLEGYADLIDIFKILKAFEDVDKNIFFKYSSTELRGHTEKLLSKKKSVWLQILWFFSKNSRGME